MCSRSAVSVLLAMIDSCCNKAIATPSPTCYGVAVDDCVLKGSQLCNILNAMLPQPGPCSHRSCTFRLADTTPTCYDTEHDRCILDSLRQWAHTVQGRGIGHQTVPRHPTVGGFDPHAAAEGCRLPDAAPCRPAGQGSESRLLGGCQPVKVEQREGREGSVHSHCQLTGGSAWRAAETPVAGHGLQVASRRRWALLFKKVLDPPPGWSLEECRHRVWNAPLLAKKLLGAAGQLASQHRQRRGAGPDRCSRHSMALATP